MRDSSTEAARYSCGPNLERAGVDGVCGLLREAWPDLKGSDQEGMAPYKLTEDRIEQPAWEPPVLTFVIERHGGTAQGPCGPICRHGSLDLVPVQRKPAHQGRRQLRPMSPRLDVTKR